MTVNFNRTHAILVGVLVAALIFGVWAVSGNNRDPNWLRENYGITNAFSQKVQTPDGAVTASLVPVTMADGRTAYLVIPQKGDNIYLKDESEIVPVQATDRGVSKDQFVRSQPVIVERPTNQASASAPVNEPVKKKRSTKREVLIVAGSAGTGAAIGGIAGGKKGAAVGAVSGGVAGLIYDIATRNK